MAATESTTKLVRGEFAEQLICRRLGVELAMVEALCRRLDVELAMVEALLVCGGDGVAFASGPDGVHLC